ncbi:unnamed protein product [Symbiodinium natans]|uniref:Pentacotripeptide-repeat region of PRORP domain-containing protein n=1 Tax=Symbiodinium natans TaxID=878477 RepID=A0A812T4D6_9DINO|nr:unnamed protein product [Symbiodinium natans]
MRSLLEGLLSQVRCLNLGWELLIVLLVVFNFFVIRLAAGRLFTGHQAKEDHGVESYPSHSRGDDESSIPEERSVNSVNRVSAAEEAFCKKVLASIQLGDIAGSTAAFQEAVQKLSHFSRAPALLMKTLKVANAQGTAALAWDLYCVTKEHVEYSRGLYHTLLSVLAKSEDPDHPISVLRDMTLQDVVPDSGTYACVIRGQLAKGDLESSVQMLGQMQRRGVTPDIAIFHAVLEACAHRQLPMLAEQIFGDMEEIGIVPSSTTLTLLIRLHSRCGDLGAAMRVFRELPPKYDLKLDAPVYGCLAAACMAEGEVAQAFQIYEQMSAARCHVDASVYKLLLTGSLQQGDLDAAARLIDDAFLGGTVLPRESLEIFLLQAHRRGRGELAVPVLEQAQQAGVYISERIANSILNTLRAVG